MLTPTVTTRVTHELQLDKMKLIELLRPALDFGSLTPADISITVRVPGGGDWSNTSLDLGDHPVKIVWMETPTMSKLPTLRAGHATDADAWAEFHRQYNEQPRSRPDLTDFQLANAVFMASRHDLDLIVYQTAAKERIRWLSLRLAAALDQIDAANELIADLVQHDGAEGFSQSTYRLLEAYNADYPSPQSPTAAHADDTPPVTMPCVGPTLPAEYKV